MNDDLIRRETIIRALDKSISGMREVAAGDRIMTKAIELVQIARDFADNLPAVDAVEVIRCKDCIFKKPPRVYGNSIIGEVHCGMLGVPMNFNDFCSYGERREADGEIQKETRCG